MSDRYINVTVTKKASKIGKVFLLCVAGLGVLILIAAGVFLALDLSDVAEILGMAGIITLMCAIIGNLIILLISAVRLEKENNPHVFDHRYNKNAMPKGAWVFIGIIVLAFFIFIMVMVLG